MERALFTYEDTTVMSTDVMVLDPPHFLNDRVIGFYFDYLTKEIVKNDKIFFINPSTVFLLSFLEDPEEVKEALGALDLASRELIFIPINNNSDVSKAGGSHWSTLIYHRKSNCLYYMDSAGSYNLLAARRTAEKLTAVLIVKSKPGFNIINTPQQMNGYDCGGFVLSICEEIGVWAKDLLESGEIAAKSIEQIVAATVNPKQVQNKRQEIKQLILEMAKAHK
jgi:sentrin-specific protease 8